MTITYFRVASTVLLEQPSEVCVLVSILVIKKNFISFSASDILFLF